MKAAKEAKLFLILLFIVLFSTIVYSSTTIKVRAYTDGSSAELEEDNYRDEYDCDDYSYFGGTYMYYYDDSRGDEKVKAVYGFRIPDHLYSKQIQSAKFHGRINVINDGYLDWGRTLDEHNRDPKDYCNYYYKIRYGF